MVELSLTLPLLMILLSVIVEGGLALNAWMRVNTAARDATRFAMDSGRPNDTGSLVLTKLTGIDFGTSSTFTQTKNVDIFIITASTGADGTINSWSVNHVYDGIANSQNTPLVQQSTIQARLNSQGFTVSQSVNLTIVEVDYIYTPVVGTLLAGGAKIPMSNYAMVQENH